MQVDVGFDPDCRYGGPGDTLKTTGLGNCVALVAYDDRGGGAVMRHYDTVAAYSHSETDLVSGKEALAFDTGPLATVRDATREVLLGEVGDADVKWAVTLGGVWYNVDQEKPLWQSRYNLITSIKSVFGVEPSTASGEATWDVDQKQFT